MLISKTTNKPLPEITDQTRPFWQAAKAGKLVLQKMHEVWCDPLSSRALLHRVRV